jgi:hypothetical protein
MVGEQHMEISAQVVQKLGFYMFVIMTSLLIICIGFGFYAVIDKFKEPNWKEACLEKGGVPVQLDKSMFDCKGI